MNMEITVGTNANMSLYKSKVKRKAALRLETGFRGNEFKYNCKMKAA